MKEYQDPDEQYVFEERLAILAGDGKPTLEQVKLAHADVDRFRKERTDKLDD